jgi:DNA polymerase III epsilon subunit-like protein
MPIAHHQTKRGDTSIAASPAQKKEDAEPGNDTPHIMHHTDFISLDTETGGLDSAECALLSIAAVPSWDAPPFSVHILPVGRIDAVAAEVNGYTPELWAKKGAVPPKVAMLEFQRWLFEVRNDRRCDMAAHNAGFDLLFMSAVQARTGIDLSLPGIWHCTKILMQEKKEAGYVMPKGCKLDDLGQVSGFWKQEERCKQHDALQDARCCRHGLLWLRALGKKKEGRADG